ncbi:MAG: FAD-binding oxidoreductase [Bauldia sp.]|nr:FAD-binding oxidoreductase [Bauldia sp.]
MTKSPRPVPDSALLGQFAAIVGAANALTTRDGAAFAERNAERRGAFAGKAAMVLLPGSVAEVSAILKLAAETGTAIVPQGGNTGLVGGQMPDGSGAEIVVALTRLDAIRSVDAATDSMTVDAGVTLAAARRAAEAADRLFPLAIGSMDHCQIGGNISSNAGGVAVLAYGNTRDLVLGLEVVLPGGAVWDGLRTLRKDNAGYDLKHLFIGAEGTLGIVTGAAVKLYPRPRGKATGVAGTASPAAALTLLHLAKERAGFELTTFELLPRIAVDFCISHLPGSFDPLPERHAWYVLFEVSSGQSEAAASALVDGIVGAARASGIVETGRGAIDAAEAASLWRMRYAISDVQRPEGVSLKHDVSVPVGRVPDFLAAATAAVLAVEPEARPVPFGHLGDGNVHFNVSQPAGGDPAAFRAKAAAITDTVHAIVADFGGSIAAEHGIGQMKRALLPTVRSAVEMELMRAVKTALDPKGIMNPGKVL